MFTPQYYVLMRGFRRVNELVDAVDATRDPAGARLSLVRLSGTYDELCALVETVNRAYAPEMLVQWLYNIVRVIMVVFRLLEIASQGADAGDPASYLIAVEHVGELVMFAVHTSCTCTVGERLSAEVSARRRSWLPAAGRLIPPRRCRDVVRSRVKTPRDEKKTKRSQPKSPNPCLSRVDFENSRRQKNFQK